MYGYIYMTTNLRNNKKYVGKHARASFDKNYYGSGIVIEKALKKHGKNNFKIEILDWAENKQQLNKKEKYWIQYLEAIDSEEFYNISPGGDGGKVWKGEHPLKGAPKENHPRYGKKLSESSKLKISQSNTGKLTGSNNPMYGDHRFAGENNPNYGKQSTLGKHWNWSESSKKTLSETMKTKDMSKENNPNYDNHWNMTPTQKRLISERQKIPVVKLSLQGDFIAEYPSLQDAGKYTSRISACCKGNKDSYKGFKWMYKAMYEKISKGYNSLNDTDD